MNVLICGGRSYDNVKHFEEVMNALDKRHRFALVVHGGATGADTMARTWANSLGIDQSVYLPDWEKYGRAAGPIRNQQMLEGQPIDLVVAFPGGRGTADMVRRAKAKNITVIEVKE